MWKIRKGVGLFDGILFLNVVCCVARDVCYYSNNNYEVYCDDGYYCCQNNTRCCTEGLSTGAIIGITLAAIFVLAFCVAGAMMLIKKQKAPGRRITHTDTRNIQNVAVINPPPYTPYSAQPPTYNPPMAPNYNPPGNYFTTQYAQAAQPPPPYTPSYPPPPAYSATQPSS